MFLSRKILIANFFAAALLAPVAVHAIGASPAAPAKSAPLVAAPVIAAPVLAAPIATETKIAPVAPDAPRCAKPVRVIYPGPAGATVACAAPAKPGS